jgi:hypothetical protein
MTAPAVFATAAYCKRCGWGPTHRTHNPIEADAALTWMEQELAKHTRTHRAAS